MEVNVRKTNTLDRLKQVGVAQLEVSSGGFEQEEVR